MTTDAPLGLFEKLGRCLFGEPKPQPTYCETWGQHAFVYITERDVMLCARCGKAIKVGGE